MTVEQKVFEVLSANAALAAVVPFDRIRGPGELQNIKAPYIVHFGVSPIPRYTMDGLQEMVTWETYQITIASRTYREGNDIAGLVVTALSGVHGEYRCFWKSGHYVGRNDEIGLETFALDWRIVAVR